MLGFLATLVTVFVGALLAFVVENVRERRAVRSWVARYLVEVRQGLETSVQMLPLATAAMDEMLVALRALRAGEAPEWTALNGVSRGVSPDLLSALHGDALTVIDPETLTALSQVEQAGAVVTLRNQEMAGLYDAVVLPVYLSRPARLSPEQDRGLELFEGRLVELLAAVDVTGAAIDSALERLP